jgi:hypothetical protein
MDRRAEAAEFKKDEEEEEFLIVLIANDEDEDDGVTKGQLGMVFLDETIVYFFVCFFWQFVRKLGIY